MKAVDRSPDCGELSRHGDRDVWVTVLPIACGVWSFFRTNNTVKARLVYTETGSTNGCRQAAMSGKWRSCKGFD